MRIILLGPPGAGKGTQGELLQQKFQVPQIATGDMLRRAVREETRLGKEAQKYMQAGQLVPDEIIIGVVRERLAAPDCLQGYILDGFPRTVVQADALEQVLTALHTPLDAVVSIEVPEEELIRRLSGRWTCPQCEEIYHQERHPPRHPGVCDRCGTQLVQREDDRPETVKQRLAVYTEQTAPLKAYYRQRGLLREIDGLGSKEEVFRRICQAMGDIP
ncbi:MAG: adenylate kinase [Nitrospinota bacterium]|nr:MAG: adenylate kinase [Nitrospinota bacterium]